VRFHNFNYLLICLNIGMTGNMGSLSRSKLRLPDINILNRLSTNAFISLLSSSVMHSSLIYYRLIDCVSRCPLSRSLASMNTKYKKPALICTQSDLTTTGTFICKLIAASINHKLESYVSMYVTCKGIS
jgi:hypothetical protein